MKKEARCVLGIIFGMILGLAYGGVSQWINSVFLAGIPLFAPPPGRLVTLLIEVFSGGVLGFLVTLPEEFVLGVLISSVTGTLVSSLISLRAEMGSPEGIFGALALLVITFLPRIFFFVPVVFLVRWVVHVWEEETLDAPYSFKRRLRSVLLLIVISLVVGSFSLYPSETRKSIKNLNELILAGRQASSISSLPQPLHKVNGFLQYSNSLYTLNLVSNPEDIPIPRLMMGFNESEIGIDVYFVNGFRFSCVYSPPLEQPNCVDY